MTPARLFPGQIKTNLMQHCAGLFLQNHSTCFGRKRPSSGIFKTATAATGTCVIFAGKTSHHLIRAGTPALIR